MDDDVGNDEDVNVSDETENSADDDEEEDEITTVEAALAEALRL